MFINVKNHCIANVENNKVHDKDKKLAEPWEKY